jgi:N-acetylmuramic acid 6-phosphate etherase
LWQLDDPALVRLFRSLALQLPEPVALGIGMAGARTPADHQRIRTAAAQVWPGTPCYACSDLETGLMAAEELLPGASAGHKRAQAKQPAARVLVLSGTGSCCFGRAADGTTVRVGGWGHILGDKGSGYDIGLSALQAVVRAYDVQGRWPRLGQRFLRALALNEPEDLVPWAQQAAKKDVAALAVEVFDAWAGADPIADQVLRAAAERLAQDGAACARRLTQPGAPVQFVFAGSVLVKQPRFAALVSRLLRRRWPGARTVCLKRESVWGAVQLAWQLVPGAAPGPAALANAQPERAQPVADAPLVPPLESVLQSPTEQRNPRSMHLDRMPLADAVELMIDEERHIMATLRRHRDGIVQAIRLIVRALRRGGRLFYVGAGTSGRLGALDASECPPTFNVSPDTVQAIIAGGHTALWTSIEGAEDDVVAGGHAIEFRGVSRNDVVVGIAASGRTPFVWGALQAAQRRGATTILLCFNPHLQVPAQARPDLVLSLDVGPEVLTGSTRLKAGTATKLVLNMFSTLAMVQLGKVRSNLMIDLKPTNAKLQDRAVRIVQALTGVDQAAARHALEQSGWRIRDACARLGRKPGRRPAGHAPSRA